MRGAAERPVGTLPVAHEKKPCKDDASSSTLYYVAVHDVSSSKTNAEEHAVAEYA